MKKNSKSRKAAGLKVDPYLEGLVAKLIDRLVGLEKKVEIVITQTAGKLYGGGTESKSSQIFETKQTQQSQHRERTLYEAICADCSKVCEVPFRPVEGRAVYCKECFGKRKSGGSRHGMPILTPVALPPKPVSKLSATAAAVPVREKSKKEKKSKAAKKVKKKK